MYIIFFFLCFISLTLVTVKYNTVSRYYLALIWIVLFVFTGTFAYYTDDYDTYVDIVTRLYKNPDAAVHIEGIWIKLAEFSHNSIEIFRGITFFVLALLLIILAKCLRIQLPYIIGFYGLLCLSNHLVWLRQPVAILIFLLGFINLIHKKYLLGLILCVLTCILHKSGAMFLLFLPFVLLPINKFTIGCFLIIIPLLWFSVQSFIQSSSSLELIVLNHYASGDDIYSGRNVLFRIFFFIGDWTKLLLNFYLYIKEISILSYHKIYKFFLKYLLIISLLIIALKLLPIGADVLTTRLFSMTDLLVVCTLSYCVRNQLLKKKNAGYLIMVLLIFCTTEIMTIGRNITTLPIFLKLPF